MSIVILVLFSLQIRLMSHHSRVTKTTSGDLICLC